MSSSVKLNGDQPSVGFPLTKEDVQSATKSSAFGRTAEVAKSTVNSTWFQVAMVAAGAVGAAFMAAGITAVLARHTNLIGFGFENLKVMTDYGAAASTAVGAVLVGVGISGIVMLIKKQLDKKEQQKQEKEIEERAEKEFQRLSEEHAAQKKAAEEAKTTQPSRLQRATSWLGSFVSTSPGKPGSLTSTLSQAKQPK